MAGKNWAKGLLGGAAVAALAGWAAPAAAADCGDLAKMTLPGGKVTAAELVAPGAFRQPTSPGAPPGVGAGAYGNLPEFCRVQATLTPTSDSDIKVEVWLPAKGWNGKFVGVGNGIWAGQISYSALAETIARGYAAASTDTGHTGNGLTGEFAVGHPEKLVDFGHRAVHEMVVAAKRTIEQYYGGAPKLSFWNSCSTGGRQGLMAAYRYPTDFDAISAMAPANPMTDLMTQSMWAGWQPQRAPGAAVSVPQLASVHRAAVKQCDKLDGLADGLIGRPDACKFDPATVEGLTPAQVETMRALYQGPPGLPGWPVGSEMQMAVVAGGQTPFPVALTYYSMLAFGDRAGWDWKTFDYTRDAEAGRAYGADILDVQPNGLAAFFARGGKLLLSHGWSDGLIPATNSLRVQRGAAAHAQRTAAGEPVPAVHGPGYGSLRRRRGCQSVRHARHDRRVGDHRQGARAHRRHAADRGRRSSRRSGGPPRAPMSRPLCAWPAYARYDGSGDQADAASFTCVVPSQET